MEKWYQGVVTFNLNRKPKKFFIYNNMPDMPGLRLEDAVHNWLARTDKYTDKSLCAYINSKNTGYKVFTQEKWDKIFTKAEQEKMLHGK